MTEGARPRFGTYLITVLVGGALAAGLPTSARAADDGASSSDGTEATDDGGDKNVGSSSQSPPFRMALGPLSALRKMTFEGNEETVTHAPQPYIGGAIALAGTLWRDAELRASLEFDFEVGYGVAKNRKLDDGSGPTPVTELTYGHGRVFLNRRLGSDFKIGVGTGLRASSVVVQPNPIYTGHRYVAADTAAGLHWFGLSEKLDVSAEVGAAPVFALDNSDSGHGEGTAFGARAQAQLRWAPALEASDADLRNLRLLFRYRFQRFRSQFPLSFLGSNGAVSVDNQHILAVMVEYAVTE